MQRQPARLLPEIGERGGAYALEISAIGRKAEIETKNLVLAQCSFQADGTRHFAQFDGQRPFASRLQQARNLHRQGGTAGDDAAVLGKQISGTQQRHGIDADVLTKALVLIGQEQINKSCVDVFHRSRQTPTAVRRRIGPQKPPFPVHHKRGELQIVTARSGAEPRNPGSRGSHPGHADQ
jgi:hypothetical protein